MAGAGITEATFTDTAITAGIRRVCLVKVMNTAGTDQRPNYANNTPSRRCATLGVVNAVAPSQRRRDQGQHLVARVRPPRRSSEVNVLVDEFTQTQVLGEGDRKEQPSIGHQAVVVEGDLDTVGVLQW